MNSKRFEKPEETTGHGLGRFWGAYLSIVPFLVFPFVIFTVIGVVWGALTLFNASPFAAIVYGIITLLLVGSFLIGGRFFYKVSTRTTFLQESIGADRNERKKLSDQAVADIRRDSVWKQTKKNRRQFYKTALFVTLFIIATASYMKYMLGMYPAEVFFVPFVVLVALWFAMTLFLPRLLVIIILVMLTGSVAAVMVMGPMIILQMLPMIIMFPMMMLMNFFMMFGPLAFFNIKQIQFVRPGEANWGIAIDDVRGQDEAKKQVLTALRMIASTEGEKLKDAGGKSPRGMLFKGPPGTGKTLMAKAIGSMLNVPVVITTGAAFQATFIGIDVLVMMYLKMMTERLAKEYNGAVCFIDECELLMRSRGGENAGASNSSAVTNMWDLFDYDAYGTMSASCGLAFDTEEAREIFWDKKYPRLPETHKMMFPGGMSMGGGAAIYPFLTWLDGITSPPFWPRFMRSKANLFLDILLFVPPVITWRGKEKYLRLAPAKPADAKNLLFIAATNRPHTLDAAMLRAGRFGTHISFKTPGEEERTDIADLYLRKVKHHPDLDKPERLVELARSSVGLSPADLEQVIREGITYRNDYVHRLREMKKLDEKGKLEKLDVRALRFWEMHKHEVGQPDWDTIWVTWDSLMESLAAKRYGQASPANTTPRHRHNTAVHEVAGHFLPLAYFAGDWMRPTTLSVMPRGQALGLVHHVPLEEHDPQPQHIFDAMIRVSVGSTVAERIFFKDNQPGVVSDLENASHLAKGMTGRFGMVPRRCSSDEERGRYMQIGQTVTSSGEPNPYEMMGGGSSGGPGKQEAVLLMLGQAFVDDWRLITKNQDLVEPIVEQLLKFDEIVGKELEEVWTKLRQDIKPLTAEDLDRWPDTEVEPENPFYKTETA